MNNLSTVQAASLASRLIVAYLDPLEETGTDDEAAGLLTAHEAAEYLLRNEMDTAADLVRGDQVYPGMTFELGVQFGIEAAVATLNSPPQLARDTVRELLADLRADILGRLESARASKRLKAVV
ncbi:MAG: hypothetical protein WB681_10350 [Candidatus Cybelea sp.]